MRIERYLDKERPEEASMYDIIDDCIIKRRYSDALTLTIRHERLMNPKMFRQYRSELSKELSKLSKIEKELE